MAERSLIAASFTNIYITQPLLPVLQVEFTTSMVTISASISAVNFGITITNLPFGALSDKIPIQPIILGGSVMVALGKQGWNAVILFCISLLIIPLLTGLHEKTSSQKNRDRE